MRILIEMTRLISLIGCLICAELARHQGRSGHRDTRRLPFEDHQAISRWVVIRGNYHSFQNLQQKLLFDWILLVIATHLCSDIRRQIMEEKCTSILGDV